MKINPYIDMFMDRKSGRFAILEFTMDREKGLVVGIGDLVRIEPSDMQDRGLDLVLRHIGRFGAADSRIGSEFQRMTPALRRKFSIDHKSVTVEQRDNKTLVLEPSRRDRGGWLGCPDEATVISLPMSNEKFFELLKAIFDKSE